MESNWYCTVISLIIACNIELLLLLSETIIITQTSSEIIVLIQTEGILQYSGKIKVTKRSLYI